jgi:hypothetical protein
MADQSVFFGGKQSSGLTNTLLFLNLIGIIIIIILLLWWWPWYWGHGKAAVVGGTAVPGPGGNIIIDTCCDGGSRDCPDGKPSCEEDCKMATGGSQAAYEKCVASRCRPPPTETCEDNCYNRYGKGTTAAENCVKTECCEDSCKQRYGGTNYYSECVRTECGTPPPTETCEDYCKTLYPGPAYEQYYQQCVRERCNGKTTTTDKPDCRDSDGYNLGTAGTVVADGTTYSDTCYSSTEVTEYTCDDGEMKMQREPCQGRCEYGRCVPGTTTTDPCEEYCKQIYGSPGMEQYYQQCVQQRQCPV